MYALNSRLQHFTIPTLLVILFIFLGSIIQMRASSPLAFLFILGSKIYKIIKRHGARFLFGSVSLLTFEEPWHLINHQVVDEVGIVLLE